MAMIAAGFSGGEAEELRRAFGFKRSEARMRDIEVKLRAGMERNGIGAAAQDEIVKAITSFALYGFPESHAASFALIAYASAWLKCHYLAAFTAAMLNHQPMGFYHPATLVKDAQRHGLLIKAIDVTKSEWLCTMEAVDGRRSTVDGREWALRMGFRYVKGLREEAAQALVGERERAPFTSIDDLVRRVPALRKDELEKLAAVGALNSLGHSPLAVQASRLHRRDALWHVARAAQAPGVLFEELREAEPPSPLAQMTDEERLVADFRGTGLTVGPHPMSFRRAEMDARGVQRAAELAKLPSGQPVTVAGCVIARQRPGTAKGFVFLSLEDETGIANAIVTPDLFDRHRLLLAGARFLMVEGELQNLDNVISVKAKRVLPLAISAAETSSHDFH
jgi:error-prone DNA polymerase